MTIRFEPGHDIDTDRRCVTFAAIADEQWVFCVVPFDVLRDSFGAGNPEDPGRTFEENRETMEGLAHSLIETGLISANQEAFLNAEAVNSLRRQAQGGEP